MLTELAEADARGETAEIFAEIRRLYATAYVSSIHRHLATRPGILEWAWETVAPVFRDGTAQEAGWRIAATAALPPLAPINREALAVWGLGEADIASAAAIAESFTRVAPLNLVFGGIIREHLTGKPFGKAGAGAGARWTPPPPLASPPAMIDPAKASEALRALLARFRSGSGETAFVPGLYRMLAHWPGLLAHFAVDLAPHFSGDAKKAAAADLLQRIDAASAGFLARLDPPKRPPPSPAEAAHLVRMIDGYRVTSPEMILFGRLIREALPA